MDRNATVMGVVACTLLATIAWSTIQLGQRTERMEQSAEKIALRTEKLESAARVLMESSDCEQRCPTYKVSDTGADGHWKAPDNSARDKCTSECTGEMKQKLRTLLKEAPQSK